MTKFLAATAMALVAGAAVAVAQPTPPAPPPEKVMVRSEVQEMVRDHFARMDANKDGAITTTEITELHGKMGEHGMARHGPGAMHDPAAAFDRIDTNKDGMISRDEFAKGREMRIEKRIVVNSPEGAGHDGARRKIKIRHGGHGMAGGRMIVMADSDHDGRITMAEAEAMALQHFDRMDSNHDGRVTREERRAARPMMMKMRMAPKAG